MLKEIQGHINNNNMNFMINGIQFACIPKGQGVLVYEGNTKSAFPGRMNLALIITKKQVVVLNNHMFKGDEAENIVTGPQAKQEIQSKIQNIILKKVHGLSPDTNILKKRKENLDDEIATRAWFIALRGLKTASEYFNDALSDVVLEDETVCNILCGITTVEDYAEVAYKDMKENLLLQLTINHMAKKKAKQYESRYEINMYNMIQAIPFVNAQLVMERNGQMAEEKISASSLIHVLHRAYKDSSIQPWLFPTCKKGMAVYQQLQLKDDLKLDDIKEIQYRGKTIWTKP